MKNTFLKILGFTVATATPIFAISCKQDLTFSVEYNNDKSEKFFNDVLTKYNEIIASNPNLKNLQKYRKINANYRSSGFNLAEDIVKGTSVLGLLRIANYIEKKDNLKAILQSYTTAFNFDEEYNKNYSDGSQSDDLIKIAQTAFEKFNNEKYINWTDEKYGWDGSKYKVFYNTNKLVDFYRGNVMIWGSDQEIAQIKKAWFEKDWETFRNFGIMTGSENSASKYLLQQSLFKKHFGKKFITFAQDKLNNKDKYIIGNPKDIGKGSNIKYHIVFDELGAFAYTHNTKKGKKNDFYNPINGKIEFLTATEAAKYNVWAVNKNLNNETTDALANAILDVWKNNQDEYGPQIGINGYKKITDIENEVIKPYERLFS